MTNTSSLSASVEAARLRRIEEGEDFFYKCTQEECRQLDISQACSDWAPSMTCRHLGTDKFIVCILCPGRHFGEAFHLDKVNAFHSSELITPSVLYVRCLPPEHRRENPEQFVLEEVSMSFLPF